MSDVVSWPTITDLRHVLARVEKEAEVAATAQKAIVYRGKVKLHGANHAATIRADGQVTLQSRTTVLGDKGGFARWAKQHTAFFSKLSASPSLQRFHIKQITVFGEWAGPGIQRGSDVAIGKLPECVFCIFGIAINTGRDHDLAIIIDPADIERVLGGKAALPAGMYVIPWMADATKTLDLRNSTSAEFVRQAHEVDRLVAQVDKEDPWVRDTFGIRGPGEGIVWYPISLCEESLDGAIKAELFGALSWKAKGLSHAMTQSSARSHVAAAADAPSPSVLSCLDATPVAQTAEEFAFIFCTRTRMLQGLTEACPDFVAAELPAFVSWMIADIRKEGAIEFDSSGLSWEAVETAIRNHSESWFSEQLQMKIASSPSSSPSPSPSLALEQQRAMFAGTFFCFSESVTFKAKGELSKHIKGSGGAVLFSLSKKCTHFIAAQADANPGSPPSSKVMQAVSLGCAIVSEQFIADCIAQGKLLAADKYSPLSSSQQQTEARASEEGEGTTRRRVVERPHVWTFGTGNEPKFSADYDITRNVVLAATDFQHGNTNKFFALELHVSREAFTEGYVYRIFTQHGRTDELAMGKRGVCESRYLSSMADAEDVFDDIVQTKLETGTYRQVDLVSVSKLIGSRAMLLAGSPAVEEAAATESGKSQLPETVQSIVNLVFEKASAAVSSSVSATITRRGIETPLGVTSVAQIDRAQQVLTAIGDALLTKNAQSEIARLSGEFFSLIPSAIGTKKQKAQQAVIDTPEKLQKKEELLDVMRDLARVTEARAQKPDQSDIDEMYEALGCILVPLDHSSAAFKQLELRFVNGLLHNQKPQRSITSAIADQPRVLNIFKITRKLEQMPFAQALAIAGGKQMLLWHCSRVENFLGLLSHGILTPAALAAFGGRRGPLARRSDFGFLGAGAYFSDSSIACIKYAGQGDRLLMLGVAVATGNTADFTTVQPGLVSPPPGYHSCHGVKRGPATPNSDFAADEYVIYDLAQQKLEFLIEFCM